MPCTSCKNLHFRGVYHLCHQGDKNQQARNSVAVTSNRSTLKRNTTQNASVASYCFADPSLTNLVTLMMVASHSSKMSNHTRSSWSNIPEEGILHSHCLENLKFFKILFATLQMSSFQLLYLLTSGFHCELLVVFILLLCGCGQCWHQSRGTWQPSASRLCHKMEASRANILRSINSHIDGIYSSIIFLLQSKRVSILTKFTFRSSSPS
jgi:hypothetical protein